MGYSRAGFEVVGVDLVSQPHYPFEFHQADALEFLAAEEFWNISAIHASPPCQAYSAGARRWGTQDNHPDLIVPTRELLRATTVPWVIENIEPARDRLIDPLLLCGTMFGLGVFRHRFFEFSSGPPLFLHPGHGGRIGEGYHTVTGHAGGRSVRDGWAGGSTAQWRTAMGIDWMTGTELSQAIPPAYTEWIGARLMEYVRPQMRSEAV